MSDFKDNYRQLLCNQVRDEISYLVNNGHDQHNPVIPCIFCVESVHNIYVCGRLIELRRFQTSLMAHDMDKVRAKFQERRKIGNCPSDSFDLVNSDNLPLMFPKL